MASLVLRGKITTVDLLVRFWLTKPRIILDFFVARTCLWDSVWTHLLCITPFRRKNNFLWEKKEIFGPDEIPDLEYTGTSVHRTYASMGHTALCCPAIKEPATKSCFVCSCSRSLFIRSCNFIATSHINSVIFLHYISRNVWVSVSHPTSLTLQLGKFVEEE